VIEMLKKLNLKRMIASRLLKFLLSNVEVLEVDGIELRVGGNTVRIDGSSITLQPLTSNPTLASGKIWFRSDLSKILYSPDGTNVKDIHPALWDDITNKPSTFPPSSHIHVVGEISGYVTHIAGDDTEITTTSTSYPTSDQKYFYMSLCGGAFPLNKLAASIEGKVTSGYTLYVGIYVDGTLKTELSWTETSYTIKVATGIDLSGLSTTVTHQVGIRMKVTGGTGYVRSVDFYWLR